MQVAHINTQCPDILCLWRKGLFSAKMVGDGCLGVRRGPLPGAGLSLSSQRWHSKPQLLSWQYVINYKAKDSDQTPQPNTMYRKIAQSLCTTKIWCIYISRHDMWGILSTEICLALLSDLWMTESNPDEMPIFSFSQKYTKCYTQTNQVINVSSRENPLNDHPVPKLDGPIPPNLDWW